MALRMPSKVQGPISTDTPSKATNRAPSLGFWFVPDSSKPAKPQTRTACFGSATGQTSSFLALRPLAKEEMAATFRSSAAVLSLPSACPLRSVVNAAVSRPFGLTGAGEELPLDILTTILQENSIKGSVAGMGQDMHDALTLLTHGRIDPAPFLGADFALDDIQTAFDTFTDRPEDLKTQIVMAH